MKGKNTRAWLVLSLYLFLMLQAQKVQGQKSIDGINAFLKVCNIYKELPLQLNIELRKSSNLPEYYSDTSTVRLQFYLQEKSSYIQMGDLEQIVEDSTMIYVSNKLHRMMLYHVDASAGGQLKKMVGLQLKDSSAKLLSKNYTVKAIAGLKDTAISTLTSRKMLNHTDLPVDEVSVKFNTNSYTPYTVTQIRRSLIPISRKEFQSKSSDEVFKQDHQLVEDSTTAKDKQYFVVGVHSETYVYSSIRHMIDEKSPALIKDRLMLGGDGKWKPAKGFEDYLITDFNN